MIGNSSQHIHVWSSLGYFIQAAKISGRYKEIEQHLICSIKIIAVHFSFLQVHQAGVEQ